jgi:hypothetical protein
MNGSNHIWLKWLAGIALVGGLFFGSLALAASIGIWAGLWDFRRGFALLGLAHDWGWIAAIACLLDAIAIFVLARLLGIANGTRLATLALVGTVTAALAYFIPESYRPPEGTPPIHDITTDTNDPPTFVDALPLRADAENSAVYGEHDRYDAASLAEAQRGAYPDIVTRQFSEPAEAIFTRALDAVEALGWDVVAQVPEEGRIEATDTTFWFRFKDDIVIRIRPTASGSVLDIRSLSRVGGGDAGTNAARIRKFFATLDAVSRN